MSQYYSTVLLPNPISLGAMGPSDLDGAFLIDATKAMQQRGVVLFEIGTPIVQAYIDDQLVNTGDMIVSNQSVISSPVADLFSGVWIQPGYGWTFQAQTNGAVVDYYLVGFPLILTNDNVITRWVRIPITTNPG